MLDVPIPSIGDPHYDDTSLALLFSQLKMKTLQTAKGTSEISGRREFNFVLQIARVFCRMGTLSPSTHTPARFGADVGNASFRFIGCHILALDLVKSWSFARPAGAASAGMSSMFLPITPISATTLAVPFAMPANTRRESKILIDMEMLTEPPTRRASPELKDLSESGSGDDARTSELVHVATPRTGGESGLDGLQHLEDEGDLLSRKAGLGGLIKSAKQNIQVPEFDMGSFGF